MSLKCSIRLSGKQAIDFYFHDILSVKNYCFSQCLPDRATSKRLLNLNKTGLRNAINFERIRNIVHPLTPNCWFGLIKLLQIFR